MPSVPAGRTLVAFMASRADNWLPLRMLAALAVLFGHCYALKAGPQLHDPLARLALGPGVYIGALAVDAFFFISGFLVAGSWQRQGGLARYVGARAARILPGYWVLLLLSVLLLGPALTTLPLDAYFSAPATWDYLRGNLLYAHRWFLPGVYEQLPYAGVVNGSLWSLRVEVLAYVALAVAGLLGLLQRRWLYLPGVLLALWLLHGVLPRYGSGDYLWPLSMFALGSLAWSWRESLPLSGWLLATLLLACAASLHTPLFRPLLALLLGYGCLWLAYRHPLRLPAGVGDYSYGLYLYAFPIQQWTIWMWGFESVWAQFALAAPLTLACAMASWHGVERPCLEAWRRKVAVKRA